MVNRKGQGKERRERRESEKRRKRREGFKKTRKGKEGKRCGDLSLPLPLISEPWQVAILFNIKIVPKVQDRQRHSRQCR